jgi:hypothetical protein
MEKKLKKSCNHHPNEDFEWCALSKEDVLSDFNFVVGGNGGRKNKVRKNGCLRSKAVSHRDESQVLFEGELQLQKWKQHVQQEQVCVIQASRLLHVHVPTPQDDSSKPCLN